MGTDIHLHAEYRRHDRWWPIAYAEFWTPRNYNLFSDLSGVRGGGGSPVAAGRGIPGDSDFTIQTANLIPVKGKGQDGIAMERAEEFVARWGSKWHPKFGKDSDFPQITNPDFHSHSWCTVEEFRQVLQSSGALEQPEYKAILALAESYTKGGYEFRFVFWYDN